MCCANQPVTLLKFPYLVCERCRNLMCLWLLCAFFGYLCVYYDTVKVSFAMSCMQALGLPHISKYEGKTPDA